MIKIFQALQFANGWMVWGSNHSRRELFRTHPKREFFPSCPVQWIPGLLSRGKQLAHALTTHIRLTLQIKEN
jgi:hypothetical protein